MTDDKGMIVAGSVFGALAGGVPGAIVGGFIGSAIQEWLKCPRCGETMYWEKFFGKYRCPKCGYNKKR